MEQTLTLEQRQACLGTLTAARLRELLDAVGVPASGRRAKGDLIAALAQGDVSFRAVIRVLKLPELKRISEVLALENHGRTKDALIERIVSAAAAPTATRSSSSAPPPMSARTAGTLKSALRRFVLGAAGGYRGRDAETKFTTGLLACFGWPEGCAPGASTPARLSIVEHGERTTRDVAALWNDRRALIEVTKHDVMLDFAWKDLLRACLQLDPVPQYVILTNQRDLHLYDLARDRESPRLSIPIDDLPKYSEAFPFLSAQWVPGTTPKIINVGKVSREVADLVAKLYRSLHSQHRTRQAHVIKFTLQCIITMFAEDIGLLPQEYFTSLLYEGARKRDIETRLRDFFRVMSTRDVSAPRVVPYFNGGLFKDPVTLPLGDEQLKALTKAAEANWRYVDPHIFGSVFQGIMDDAERHASGAHYTAHDDIMRVVGPTITEPWRKRIRAASTLAELLDVRADLFKFRVLDPACGSGNFLYVAFRELYRLDTELLARVREFPSTQGTSKNRIAWSSGIQTSNFFGIDINPFAVELARVTLNIAKKIAFEERKETAAEASVQLEMDVDPSLPLDNLDDNIVCADALFTAWPQVDAIVGNPPILGDRKLRGELGSEYVERLKEATGIGLVDLSCYWFRLAHDRLPSGGRCGLVGTSGIRIGKAREASLDYIVERGGTLTNAVSSRLWPGEAALDVSMVNWVKGPADGPHHLIVDDIVVPQTRIPTHLQLHTDVSAALDLAANGDGTAMGVIFGCDLFFAGNDSGLPLGRLRSKGIVRPVSAGTAMLTGKLTTSPEYCVFLGDCETEGAAKARGEEGFAWLKQTLLPHVRSVEDKYSGWLERWWQPLRPQTEFFAKVRRLRRHIACSSPQARPIFSFLSSTFVPNNTLQVFAFDDDYSFGIIQSTPHWRWTVAKGGKVRADIRYTNDVWSTFPWPQEPSGTTVARVASAAQSLRAVRRELMEANGWSLRALHQAAEVPGAHPLKEAQHALDETVAAAYGMPADQDALEFLLDLNRCVAEDEEQGRKVTGPGLPTGLDPSDARWSSTDCIEPPPLDP